jgi:hypothetical protein
VIGGENDADGDANNCNMAKQPMTAVVGDRGAMARMVFRFSDGWLKLVMGNKQGMTHLCTLSANPIIELMSLERFQFSLHLRRNQYSQFSKFLQIQFLLAGSEVSLIFYLW